jgi:GntR family transcriptional regulator
MVNHVSSTFRHAELAAELTSEIASGRYPIGGRFPTEQELQTRFGVGRHTIREAMKVMTEQGLLGRRRKTGTTVLSLQPVSQYVHSLRDIHSLFDFAQNTQLDVRYQGFASMQHPVSDNSGLDSGRYFRLAGVRSKLSNGKPLCWSEILIPERYAPDRSTLGRGDRAIYELVIKQHGLKLEFVEQEVSAMDLPPQFAQLIDADGQTAALMVRRRYFTARGEMFEMTSNLYPADRFSVRTTVRQRA